MHRNGTEQTHCYQIQECTKTKADCSVFWHSPGNLDDLGYRLRGSLNLGLSDFSEHHSNDHTTGQALSKVFFGTPFEVGPVISHKRVVETCGLRGKE